MINLKVLLEEKGLKRERLGGAMDSDEIARLTAWLMAGSTEADDDLMPNEMQFEEYLLGIATPNVKDKVRRALKEMPEEARDVMERIQKELKAPLTVEAQAALSRIQAKINAIHGLNEVSLDLPEGQPQATLTQKKQTLQGAASSNFPARARKAVLSLSENARAILAVLPRPQFNAMFAPVPLAYAPMAFAPKNERPCFSEKIAVGDFQVLLREAMPWSDILQQEPGQPNPKPVLIASVRTLLNPECDTISLSIRIGNTQETRPISLTYSGTGEARTGADSPGGGEWSGRADFGPIEEFIPPGVTEKMPPWVLEIL